MYQKALNPAASSFIFPLGSLIYYNDYTSKGVILHGWNKVYNTFVAMAPKKVTSKSHPVRRNVVAEFNKYFGNQSRLENWQMLCRDLEVGGNDLNSITKCKKALVGVYVNIWDLLDAVADDNMPPQKFASAGQLARYTRHENKYFPLAKSKAGGPARALLIHIY